MSGNGEPEGGQGGTRTEDGAKPQEGTQQQGGDGGSGAANGGDQGSGDGANLDLPGDDSWPVEARQALKAARDDAAKRRIDNKGLADKVAEHERAKMSEIEQAQADAKAAADRAEAAETALRAERSRQAIVAAATTAKFRHPTLVADTIRPEQIEYDDEGKPKNIEALVAEKAKQYPDLIAAPGGFDGGAGTQQGNGRKPRSMNDIIRNGAQR